MLASRGGFVIEGLIMTDLIDGGGKLRAIKNLAQLCGTEVGDADAARQPLLLDRLHFLPHRFQPPRLLIEMHGRVDEEQVDVIEPQLGERLYERIPHALALGRPAQLRRDEQLLTGFSRRSDARAERLLVVVHLRAIEMRKARIDRAGHQLLRIL